MTDTLTNIEDAQAQRDIGTFAYRIYDGARSDGASVREAFTVTSAWFLSLLKQNSESDQA